MTPEEKQRTLVENLCSLFPDVECEIVQEVYFNCNWNYNEAVSQLSSLFAVEEPKPLLNEQKEQKA